MSKKRKHGGGKQGFDLFERAQRELAKGNIKDALKEAKVCYRDDPRPEHRHLLERAYCARAEQLQKAGLNDQARNAFSELTELGVSSPEVQAQLPRLRILLGLLDSAPAGGAASVWDANPELLIELADQAVFHPQRVPAAYAEIHRECQQVRAALEAVERGDDAAAADQLNSIPRRSPYADWKLFVRGLSAFYASDPERSHANWDRLDPKRPAFRIAQTLLVHSGQLAAEAAAFSVANGLRRLDFALESDPVWAQLKVMTDHFQAGHWSGLFHAYRSFCQRFAGTHAALIERITDMLWKRVVRERWDEGFERLVRIVPAPRLDPRWNRARALLAEDSPHETYQTVEGYWQAYAQDILQGSFLPEDERAIAAGLIYQRLARAKVEAAHREESRFSFYREDDYSNASGYRHDAGRFYRQSIRHAPRLHSAYGELAKLHLEQEEEAEAVKVYQLLLKQFPDDYATHVWLANYYLEDDKPDKAERYALEAQRLKPRDAATVSLMWSQRVAMVRMCAKQRKIVLARQEWETLPKYMPPDAEAYWLDLLRAAIEYKAKNKEEAERWVAAAEAKLKEPTPAWLIMHAHAARIGLDREIKNHFGNRLKAALAHPCCSETAGQLTKFLYPFVVRQIKYVGLATHKKLTLECLARCTGVEWNGDDLRHVVNFLCVADSWRHAALRDRLLAEGCKRFPTDPQYPYLSGRVAMGQGPYRADALAIRNQFELALKLNETAAHPLGADSIKLAKQAISTLNETLEMQRASFFGGPWSEDEDEDYEDDEFFEDGDDEDDEFYEDDEDDEDDFDAPLSDAQLKNFIPAFLLEALKRAARERGLSLEELMHQLVSGELLPADVLGDAGPPPPFGPFGGRGGSKKKAARR